MASAFRLSGAFCLALLATTAAAQQDLPPDAPRPGTAAPLPSTAAQTPSIDRVREIAKDLAPLRAIIVAQNGVPLLEERVRGAGLDEPVNIKSASKTIIATLVGRAIAEGHLSGPDQKIAPLLERDLPETADPRLATITLGNLLSMQAGLERASGPNYGAFVGSPNWVRYVLSRPFVGEPGGGMLYSTGNTHLLSAILTRTGKRSTRALFDDWIGRPLNIRAGGWERDPQGIYLGGNEMALSPRALLRFGEMIRNGGKVGDDQIVPAEWIAESWKPRTRSVFSGESYGYGWFITEMRGHPVYYAWGYGGQMLYLVPELKLTVVITSDTSMPGGRTGHVRDLHRLLADEIIPAVTGRG
jgi:CubicO group peptidase (beta-lactamase class C family)